MLIHLGSNYSLDVVEFQGYFLEWLTLINVSISGALFAHIYNAASYAHCTKKVLP